MKRGTNISAVLTPAAYREYAARHIPGESHGTTLSRIVCTYAAMIRRLLPAVDAVDLQTISRDAETLLSGGPTLGAAYQLPDEVRDTDLRTRLDELAPLERLAIVDLITQAEKGE